jgi:phosphatidylinositol alpha-1,6-mannosyltransferase
MIQYMAVGIPIVASHTEVNSTVVENDVNGYLVQSDAEWIERISQLLEDAQLRGRLGERGRAIVEERFALEKQAKIMADLLRHAAGSVVWK